MSVVLVAAGCVFAGLATAVALALTPSARHSGVARSLDLARGPAGPVVEVPGQADGGRSTRERTRERIWTPVSAGLRRLGSLLVPTSSSRRLRRRLDLAGNTPPWDLQSVLVLKAAGTLGVGGLGGLLWWGSRSGTGLLLFGGLVALGYWLADLLLYNVGVKRQDLMRRQAPDVLDMLTVCVEAGLGFDAALAQVAANSSGPLVEEFARVLKEVQLGRARSQAFGDLAGRTDVPELKAFVGALVQADRLGVPIGGVLREQAGELRLRRRQLAEEKAQKVPVKIIFPVMFCIFPTFFVVVIGPGVLRMIEVFSRG
jgi:tight adherence protein C